MARKQTGKRGIDGAVKNNIRRLRFENDEMTQQVLADRVGATRQTIHAIESAKYAPSLELAFKIAVAFDVEIQDVFSYEQSTSAEASE